MEVGLPPALFSYAECSALDAASIRAGFSELQLMGQAALASLYALETAGVLARYRRLLILCGPGNNGGDGYALAYHLESRAALFADGGPELRLFRSVEPKSATAKFYAEKVNAPVASCEEFLALCAGDGVRADDCLIDALLGTGQSGAPRGIISGVIGAVRRLRADVDGVGWISLDLPTGLRENETARFAPPRQDGEDSEVLPAPDEVHCYGVEKLALHWNASLVAFTNIRTLPMGFLPDEMQTSSQAIRRLEFREDLRAFFRKNDLDHKYGAGHGLLIGGSEGMEGALIMAARSFFAGGGGILHALVPSANSRAFLTQALPNVMFHDFASGLPQELRPRSIVAGPGLAEKDLAAAGQLLTSFLQDLDGNPGDGGLVLDAGATTLIRNLPDAWRRRTILTPHAGEWRKLGGPGLGMPAALIDSDDQLETFMQSELRCTVLVKDSASVLLTPENAHTRAWVWNRPAGDLATAGSGDCLAGLLGAVFARRGRTLTMERASAAALALLYAAGERGTHPRGDELPELMCAVLGTESAADEER